MSISSNIITTSEHSAIDEIARFRVYGKNNFHKTEFAKKIGKRALEEIKVVSEVLPFRVNEYVCDSLIDWDNYRDDPIYRLTIPNKSMLTNEQYEKIKKGLALGRESIRPIVEEIRSELNPHPGDQLKMNIPEVGGIPVSGLQHKYERTVLYFPSSGQVCHSYCTFCFRWAQFIGDKPLRMESKEITDLLEYVRANRNITDILITGGDPMVMKTSNLRKMIEPLLGKDFLHVENIRIGSKALTFWPQRFVTDSDSDDLLNLFRKVTISGKHLAFMAHYNHPKEMSTEISDRAIAAIQSTGAVIRSQGPLLKGINDNPDNWANLWRAQVHRGIVPYYMFVERDTGANNCFSVPLWEAYNIFHKSIRVTSGLARTVRGPVMSTKYGKVEILHYEPGENGNFLMQFIQHRDSTRVKIPFKSKYSGSASWFDELIPFAEADSPFFKY